MTDHADGTTAPPSSLFDVIVGGGGGDDVIDDVTAAAPSDRMIAGCLLYKFVVDMANGLVCVLGFVGNLVAFVVFHKDTMKTSTSFLFQVSFSCLACTGTVIGHSF